MKLQKHIIFSANFLKKCLLFCMYKQRKILYNEREKSCISTFCTVDFDPSKFRHVRTYVLKYTTFTEKMQVEILEAVLSSLSVLRFCHFCRTEFAVKQYPQQRKLKTLSQFT